MKSISELAAARVLRSRVRLLQRESYVQDAALKF